MKKILCLLLALLVMTMSACSVSDGNGDIVPPNTAGGVSDNSDNGGDSNEEPQDVQVEETVLVDESGVKITAKGIEQGGVFGADLKILIENNTDKDLTVQCRESSVNGYMVETMLSADVAAGKKANDAITFSDSDLEACGIKTIADMELYFHIFTTEDWETYLDTSIVQIKTSAAETYQYTYDDAGELVYEGNNVKVVVKGLSEENSIFGPGLIVYIHNSGDESVTLQTRETSVNGFMVDTIFSEEVAAGKHAIAGITFMDSDLEENEITEITDVELLFHIFNTETWDTIVDTDKITLTFG